MAGARAVDEKALKGERRTIHHQPHPDVVILPSRLLRASGGGDT